MYRKFNFKRISLPLIFILLISFFFLNNIFSFTKDTINKENRTLAKMPVFDINHLDGFPSDFENYYNDNFKLRNLFIRYYNILFQDYFKKSPLPDKVIIGKKDWYFFNGIHGSAYRGIEQFSKDELIDFKNEMLYRRHYLDNKGIKYYFVILPTKYSIYPEFIPNNITRLSKETIADQVMAVCGNNSEINILDMRKVLLNAKKKNIRMFQKTDSHWNYAGAYFCYVNMIESMKKDFPQFKPLGLDKYIVDSIWQEGGDLARMLGMDDVIKELDVRVYKNFKTTVEVGKKHNYNPGAFSPAKDFEVVSVNPQLKGPKLLVMRDSFSWLLINYLSEHFSRSVYIWDNWEYKLNEDIIEIEKPDVVVSIVLESNLKFILKHMSHKKGIKKL